jgi:hypothetical protein
MPVVCFVLLVLAVILAITGVIFLNSCIFDEVGFMLLGIAAISFVGFVGFFMLHSQTEEAKKTLSTLTETEAASYDEYMLAEMEDGTYYSAITTEDGWIITYSELHSNKKVFKQVTVKEYSVCESNICTPYIKITKANGDVYADIYIPKNIEGE